MQAEYKKTILLVEDQAAISIAETSVLKKNGFEVIVAHNSSEAIKISRENPHLDLILMDIDLGKGMDGGEAAQIILKDHDTPIVFLSNHTEKEIVDKTEKITSYGYVLKDTGETVLIASIKMAFKLFEANKKIKNELMERKQTEEALRASEEKYRKIFENVQDVFFLTDKSGRLTDISPSIERHTEYPLEELIGQLVYQHYYNKEEQLRFLQEIKQAGEVNEFETQLITKTGKIVYVSMNAHFRRDNQANIIGIEGTLKNINERKNVEEVLRVSLTKFQVLFESFPYGITISDKYGNIKESNKEAERLLGLSNEEQMKRQIAGKEWYTIRTDGSPMPADEYASVIALKENRLVKNIEMGIVKGKDKVTWISVTAAPIPLDDYGVAIVYGDIKERKRAEEALQESEKRYKAVSELTSDYAYAFTVEPGGTLVIEWVTDGLIRLTGYSLEELRSLGGWEHLIYTEDLKVAQGQFESLISNNHAKAQYRIITKDQEIRWMIDYARPVWSFVEKRVTSIEGAVQDITEQKQAEEALQKNEEMFRRLFNVSPDAIFLLNEDGKFIDANQMALNRYGYSLDEFLTMTPLDLAAPYLVKKAPEYIKKGRQQELHFEWVHCAKNGSEFPVELHSKPIILHDKLCVFVEVRDITQRKQIEELIKDSEANLNSMINNRFESIWSIDKSYNYIILNNFFKEAYLETYGIELKKGMHALNILTPELKEFWKPKYDKALKGENVIFEITNLVGNELHYYEVSLDPIISDDKIIGVSGLSADISARKQAEQILKSAASEKEALHRELLHRVKNSFNQIKSIIYFEREKLIDPLINKILENLEMRVATLAEMYSMLNASGDSELINLGQYLEQITKSLKDSYVEDERKISVKISSDIIYTTPKIASSVGLIINELLTNSLKYAFPNSRKGIISVILKFKNENAEVEISDNGVGLPNNFDIEKSTGLGLQLVNLLVSQLSGKLTVDSKKGMRFKFVFPLDE